MSKYQITQQKGLGCCNLIIWDTLLVIAVAVFLLTPEYSPLALPFELHVVFRVLIGAAAAVVMFLLMKIKYFGAVIQVGFGALWGYFTCALLDAWFGVFKHFESDPVMWWTVTILIYALFILLHFISARRGVFTSDRIIVESLDDERIQPAPDDEYDDYDYEDEDDEPAAAVPRLDNAGVDEIGGEIERYKKMLEGFEALRGRVNAEIGDADCGELPSQLEAAALLWTNSTDRMNNYIDIFNDAESDRERARITVRMREYINELADETAALQTAYTALLTDRLHGLPPTGAAERISSVSYFHGCDTREKLDKRYKNLAKSFHPDTEAGDNESMQLVNEEYERLKKSFGG